MKNAILFPLAAALLWITACTTTTAPPATPAQRAADEAAAARVQAALTAQPDLYSKDITVSVVNGVATLGGMAWSTGDIETAGSVARAVPGITRVINQINTEQSQVGR
jgi:osmotically-inducible protein OsmY